MSRLGLRFTLAAQDHQLQMTVPTLVVRAPASRATERRYVLDFVLGEQLGIAYELDVSKDTTATIQFGHRPDHGQIVLNDTLLSLHSDEWLTAESIPDLADDCWFSWRAWEETMAVVPPGPVPVLYGQRLDNGQWTRTRESLIECGIDLFGSIFFMLTRYEEVARPVRDNHQRFPATASIAFQNGFLMRPIVDEYIEILWALLKRLAPDLERRTDEYRLVLSHDVDWPRLPRATPRRIVRSFGGDLARRGDPRLAFRRLRAYADRLRGRYDRDPYNTFDMLMSISEEHGLKSAFYFIAGHSGGHIDGEYALNDPWIRKLLVETHARGHEIGLHPSYNTYLDQDLLNAEFERLRQVAEELGIRQAGWGGRQHYLRWEAPTTWRLWDQAGLDYDSTVGFADHIGFRTGTCHDHPTFDLHNSVALRLRERPLVVMEGTLLSKTYMRLEPTKATDCVKAMMSQCKTYGGELTLLWHNNHFARDERYSDLYLQWVKMCAKV